MTKRCTVLLTEDDQEDADIMQQALIENAFTGTIQHLTNGKQLMAKLSELKNEGVLPEMIILDLNMPFMNGLEVLNSMSNEPDYKNIPIAVVTASLRSEDEKFCDSKGCSLYFKKPVRFVEYKGIAASIVALIKSKFHYC